MKITTTLRSSSTALRSSSTALRTFATALGMTSLLFTVACDNDPVGDAPKAAATEPAKQPAAEQPVAPAKQSLELDVNAQNSTLGFVGAKVTGKHDGKFKAFTGKVNLVDGDPTKSSVTVTVNMSEFETDSEKLDGHLKSPDFFDVEKHPEAKFSSTSIAAGSAKDQFNVTGNLTLRGVEKSITFPATIQTGKDSVSVKAEFGINRQDFGIAYPGMKDDLIKDEVLIKLALEPKQS